MQEKRFCYKLLSKGSSLRLATRQTQTVILNPKHCFKKEDKEIRKDVTKVVTEIFAEFK